MADNLRPDENARRAATCAASCDGCGKGGILVDTTAGEIVRGGKVWASLPEGARALMVSEDGRRILCDPCADNEADLDAYEEARRA